MLAQNRDSNFVLAQNRDANFVLAHNHDFQFCNIVILAKWTWIHFEPVLDTMFG